MIFDKTEAKTSVELSSFFLLVLVGALVEFVLLLLFVLLLYYYKGIICSLGERVRESERVRERERESFIRESLEEF